MSVAQIWSGRLAFAGVVGCDYHSAYRKFLHDIGASMQFCWAHLIRDVKYLVTLPDKVTRRFVVIDRKITQGTRGQTGRRWCERVWTVLATCAQQGRSAFDFLHASIRAHFNNQAPPSLLPLPP